jgi:hypothetical protein
VTGKFPACLTGWHAQKESTRNNNGNKKLAIKKPCFWLIFQRQGIKTTN